MNSITKEASMEKPNNHQIVLNHIHNKFVWSEEALEGHVHMMINSSFPTFWFDKYVYIQE